MRIDIPLPTPEDPECTTLPLDGAHATLAATTPKTPWKPRITLMAEVNDLLNQGMADDYNRKSEHSTVGKEAATEADMQRQRSQLHHWTPPHKQVWRRWRLSWRVTPSMFLLPQLHAAAIVTVQWWTSQGFRKMPT